MFLVSNIDLRLYSGVSEELFKGEVLGVHADITGSDFRVSVGMRSWLL